MTKDQLKTQIDTDITNKTTTRSISPLNVGNNMKDVVDIIPDVTDKESISNKSINIITDNASDIKYPSAKAVATYVDNLTAESYTNKSTNITADATSDVKYPSVKAVNDKLILKTDSGGSTKTTQDLDNEITGILANVRYVGDIHPSTDISGETGNIYADVLEAGTYTNWGGVVVPANTRALLKRVGGVFSSSMSTLDLSGYKSGTKKQLFSIIPSSYISNGVITTPFAPYRIKVYSVTSGEIILVSGRCEGAISFYSFYTDALCTDLVSQLGNNTGITQQSIGVVVPNTANYIAISEPIAYDSYFVYDALPIQVGIENLDKKVTDESYYNKAYQNIKTIASTEDGKYIDFNGYVGDSIGFSIKKYSVVAGDSLKITAKEKGFASSWCFYNSSTFTAGNVVTLGTALNNTTATDIDEILIVPPTATYLGVTHNKTNPDFFVNIYNSDNVDKTLTQFNNDIKSLTSNLSLFLEKDLPIDVKQGYIGEYGVLVSPFVNYNIRIYDTLDQSQLRVLGRISGYVMPYCWYSDINCTTVVEEGIFESHSDALIDVILDVKSRYLAITKITNPSADMDIYLKNTTNEIITKIYEENFPDLYISADGDSLTAGAGGSGVTYLNTLKNLLGVNYKERNLGVGGETTLTIGARTNTLFCKIKNNISLPSTTTSIIIGDTTDSGLISSWDDISFVKPLLQGSGNINPITISGIECTLSFDGTNYKINRNIAGTAKTLIANTPIYCNAGKISREDNIKIIYVGTNGGYSTPDELVAQIKNMVDYYSTSKVIVIGLHYSVGNISDNTYDLPMQKAFGNKFFNNRQYMISNAIKDAISIGLLPNDGTYPTAQDLIDMGNGYPPESLRSDGIHFNSIGYTIMGYKLFEVGKNLGYW